MNRLGTLVLAPYCDPDGVGMQYVTCSHTTAFGKRYDVTLVIGAPVENNVRCEKRGEHT